jgi:hypothetical protein
MPVIASVFTLVTLMFFVVTPIGSLIVIVLTVALSLIFSRYAPAANQVIGVVVSIGILTSLVGCIINGRVIVEAKPQFVAGFTLPTANTNPNIYFIVPDRMPSPDAMRESGIDPSDMVAKLRALGFYVKEDQLSHDSYLPDMPTKDITTTRTMRFFASVLNGGIDVPLNMEYKTVRAMINDPEMIARLRRIGYTATNVGSWFQETKDIAAMDTNLKYRVTSFVERLFQDELSIAFWERTVLSGFNFRRLESSTYQGNLERGRIEWTLFSIWDYVEKPNTSQFVMAHVLMPHEPFIYNADGQPQEDDSLSQVEKYYQQIEYASHWIVTIAQLIRERDPSAIVIIQSDEGMGYRKPTALNFTLTPVQWNGVLTAWYAPNVCQSCLPTLKHTEILRYVVDAVTNQQ